MGNNNLPDSGERVFHGQFQQSDTPGNNYLTWITCSISLDELIEATFTEYPAHPVSISSAFAPPMDTDSDRIILIRLDTESRH